jgi:hypothetical protein
LRALTFVTAGFDMSGFRNAALFACALGAVEKMQCQQPAAVTRADSAGRFHYALERHLVASPAVEIAQRAHLAARVKELETLRAHTSESAFSLYRTLVLADSVAAEAKRHL